MPQAQPSMRNRPQKRYAGENIHIFGIYFNINKTSFKTTWIKQVILGVAAYNDTARSNTLRSWTHCVQSILIIQASNGSKAPTFIPILLNIYKQLVDFEEIKANADPKTRKMVHYLVWGFSDIRQWHKTQNSRTKLTHRNMSERWALIMLSFIEVSRCTFAFGISLNSKQSA